MPPVFNFSIMSKKECYSGHTVFKEIKHVSAFGFGHAESKTLMVNFKQRNNLHLLNSLTFASLLYFSGFLSSCSLFVSSFLASFLSFCTQGGPELVTNVLPTKVNRLPN